MNEYIENDFFIVINTTRQYSGVIASILNKFLRKNNGKCLVIEGIPLDTKNIIKNLQKTDEKEELSWDVETRVQFKVPEKKSIQEIINLGADLSVNDTLIVVGFERFISDLKVKYQSMVEYSGLKIRTFKKADIDWTGIDDSLELVRSINSNNVVLINCEATCKDELLKSIETGDWDIVISESEETDEDKESYDFQVDVINSIGKVEKEELIKHIDKNTTLPLQQKEKLKAYVYIDYHDREKAIKLLESIYDCLEFEEKKLYADLLDSSGRSDDALKIFEEILKKDQFIYGLWPSVLRTARNVKSTKFDEYIQHALKFDYQNEQVIAEAANYYVRKGLFSEAAKYWRIIFTRNHNAYYEILARVCEIEENRPDKLSEALAYIHTIADNNPELEAEVNYRNGRIAFELYRSAYTGYNLLSKVTNENDANAYEAAKIRMDILQDPLHANKVEKQAKKRPQLLANLKLQELYRSMDALSKKEQGCGRWQEFMEKAQSEEAWNRVITQDLVYWLKSVKIDSILYLPDTVKYGDEKDESKAADAINLIRCNKAMTAVPVEDIDEIIKASYYCLFYMKSTIRQKLWYLYEISVTYALLGRGQDGINAALQILQYAESVSQPYYKDLGHALGFLAWGHAQFRIGSKVEGMICILHALHSFARKTGTAFFTKEVLNVIFSWVSAKTAVDSELETTCKQFFYDLHDKCPEDNIIEIMADILNRDYEKVYQRLKMEIHAAKPKDGTWLTDFENYVATCIQLNKISEARDAIQRELESILPLLDYRGDIKASLLNSWAQIFIQEMKLEDIRIAEKLMDSAVQSVENERAMIAFRTERAGFADMSRRVYKTYLDVQGLIIQSNDFLDKEKKDAKIKIFQALNAIAPRSILESVSNVDCSCLDNEREELDKIAQRYRSLTDELNRSALLHGFSDTAEKENERAKLADILKQRHPEYKALTAMNMIAPAVIVKRLTERDVVYQYIQTNYGVAYFIADNKSWDTGFILGEVNKANKLLYQLADLMQNFSVPSNMKSMIGICYELSMVMHQPLLSKLASSDIDRVFICPDMSLPLYSSNLIRSESGWLIEQVDSIINIIGLNKLMDRDIFKDAGVNKSLVVTLGKKDDEAMKIARDWAKKNKDELGFLSIDDLNQTFDDIVKTAQEIEVSTVVIIGHGVPDPLSSCLSGAMYIGSNHGAVWPEELVRMKQNISNIILLTCSSGTPQIGLVESGNSVWNGMMRAAFSGTVLCRWDVAVMSSTDIVSNLLKAPNIQLPSGLIYAQREISKTEKWGHPFYWAALEYWMN